MKRCQMCGCLLPDNHEEDVCECCMDDLDEHNPLNLGVVNGVMTE